MTPKEKAKELVFRFYEKSDLLFESLSFIQAKECALIAVDEIIDALENNASNSASWEFYEEVKKEIKKL